MSGEAEGEFWGDALVTGNDPLLSSVQNEEVVGNSPKPPYPPNPPHPQSPTHGSSSSISPEINSSENHCFDSRPHWYPFHYLWQTPVDDTEEMEILRNVCRIYARSWRLDFDRCLDHWVKNGVTTKHFVHSKSPDNFAFPESTERSTPNIYTNLHRMYSDGHERFTLHPVAIGVKIQFPDPLDKSPTKGFVLKFVFDLETLTFVYVCDWKCYALVGKESWRTFEVDETRIYLVFEDTRKVVKLVIEDRKWKDTDIRKYIKGKMMYTDFGLMRIALNFDSNELGWWCNPSSGFGALEQDTRYMLKFVPLENVSEYSPVQARLLKAHVLKLGEPPQDLILPDPFMCVPEEYPCRGQTGPLYEADCPIPETKQYLRVCEAEQQFKDMREKRAANALQVYGGDIEKLPEKDRRMIQNIIQNSETGQGDQGEALQEEVTADGPPPELIEEDASKIVKIRKPRKKTKKQLEKEAKDLQIAIAQTEETAKQRKAAASLVAYSPSASMNSDHRQPSSAGTTPSLSSHSRSASPQIGSRPGNISHPTSYGGGVTPGLQKLFSSQPPLEREFTSVQHVADRVQHTLSSVNTQTGVFVGHEFFAMLGNAIQSLTAEVGRFQASVLSFKQQEAKSSKEFLGDLHTVLTRATFNINNATTKNVTLSEKQVKDIQEAVLKQCAQLHEQQMHIFEEQKGLVIRKHKEDNVIIPGFEQFIDGYKGIDLKSATILKPHERNWEGGVAPAGEIIFPIGMQSREAAKETVMLPRQIVESPTLVLEQMDYSQLQQGPELNPLREQAIFQIKNFDHTANDEFFASQTTDELLKLLLALRAEREDELDDDPVNSTDSESRRLRNVPRVNYEQPAVPGYNSPSDSTDSGGVNTTVASIFPDSSNLNRETVVTYGRRNNGASNSQNIAVGRITQAKSVRRTLKLNGLTDETSQINYFQSDHNTENAASRPVLQTTTVVPSPTPTPTFSRENSVDSSIETVVREAAELTRSQKKKERRESAATARASRSEAQQTTLQPVQRQQPIESQRQPEEPRPTVNYGSLPQPARPNPMSNTQAAQIRNTVPIGPNVPVVAPVPQAIQTQPVPVVIPKPPAPRAQQMSQIAETVRQHINKSGSHGQAKKETVPVTASVPIERRPKANRVAKLASSDILFGTPSPKREEDDDGDDSDSSTNLPRGASTPVQERIRRTLDRIEKYETDLTDLNDQMVKLYQSKDGDPDHWGLPNEYEVEKTMSRILKVKSLIKNYKQEYVGQITHQRELDSSSAAVANRPRTNQSARRKRKETDDDSDDNFRPAKRNRIMNLLQAGGINMEEAREAFKQKSNLSTVAKTLQTTSQPALHSTHSDPPGPSRVVSESESLDVSNLDDTGVEGDEPAQEEFPLENLTGGFSSENPTLSMTLHTQQALNTAFLNIKFDSRFPYGFDPALPLKVDGVEQNNVQKIGIWAGRFFWNLGQTVPNKKKKAFTTVHNVFTYNMTFSKHKSPDVFALHEKFNSDCFVRGAYHWTLIYFAPPNEADSLEWAKAFKKRVMNIKNSKKSRIKAHIDRGTNAKPPKSKPSVSKPRRSSNFSR